MEKSNGSVYERHGMGERAICVNCGVTEMVRYNILKWFEHSCEIDKFGNKRASEIIVHIGITFTFDTNLRIGNVGDRGVVVGCCLDQCFGDEKVRLCSTEGKSIERLQMSQIMMKSESRNGPGYLMWSTEWRIWQHEEAEEF